MRGKKQYVVREERHEAVTIPLDKDHTFLKGNVEVSYIAPKSRKIVKWLRESLKKDLANWKHCPNCGGILPELMFNFEGKEYWFTCYMIREDGKIIAETDYENFAGYCRARDSLESGNNI